MGQESFFKKIKKFIKYFITYSLEDDFKVYRIKGTHIQFRYPLCRQFDKEWALIPVEKNKIIFDNYMGRGYGCNGKYITEQLLKTPENYHIVWCVRDVEKNRKYFPREVELVEYLSPEAFRAYASAKVWVCNYHLIAYFNKGLQKKKEQIYIQTWHGSFGIKKIENNFNVLTSDSIWTYLAKKNSSLTDYWVSNSSFETDVYRRAFWNISTVLEYGHPRNDIFFRETASIARRIKEQLGIPFDNKIVLYVPTFRDLGGYPSEGLDCPALMKSLRTRFGGTWSFLIRLHPRMSASDITLDISTVTDVTEYPDIQELLAAADVVITDYSSCIFDFLLSQKPGFLYAPDHNKYNEMRGFYYPLTDTPFPVADNNKELQSCILSFHEESYKLAVQNFLKQKGSAENGTASLQVKALIDSFIQ